MRSVVVVGAGHVGLTTAAAFAHLGRRVVCIDIDEAKVSLLRRGDPTFHEPGLGEALAQVRESLHFATSYDQHIADAEVIVIAVDTPAHADGRPDLRSLEAAAREVGRNLGDHFSVIVTKSTVPIGCGDWLGSLVRASLPAGATPRFAIASNPEFLREGSALHDTFYPDRVVLGANDGDALVVLERLYRPILDQSFVPPTSLPRPSGLVAVPLLTTDLASAELMKYAANAFLALKISFVNEMAELAEHVGADVTRVASGIGLDPRIGGRFLDAGIGWGGSCFGKDTASLIATAKEHDLTMPIVQAAREVNYRQRRRVVEKIARALGGLEGRVIGLLGIAFKPNTDDLRDAPALDVAKRLVDGGAIVRAHDPVAMPAVRRGAWAIDCLDTPELVAKGADALVLITEWPQYLRLDWPAIARAMRTAFLVDARNVLGADAIERAGLRYVGMGR